MTVVYKRRVKGDEDTLRDHWLEARVVQGCLKELVNTCCMGINNEKCRDLWGQIFL